MYACTCCQVTSLSPGEMKAVEVVGIEIPLLSKKARGGGRKLVWSLEVIIELMKEDDWFLFFSSPSPSLPPLSISPFQSEEEHAMYVRFYFAIMLHLLLNHGRGVWHIANTFQCSRGFLQNLLHQSASYGSSILRFSLVNKWHTNS